MQFLAVTYTRETAVRDVNREHEEIMQAVLARSIPAATGLLDKHLSRTEEAVARLIEPGGK